MRAAADGLGGETFFVDVPVKRFAVRRAGPPSFQPLGLQSPYVVNRSVEFVGPLEMADYGAWESLRGDPAYRASAGEADVIFYIVPDCFWQMADVANVNPYGGMSLVGRVQGDGYAIYEYRAR